MNPSTRCVMSLVILMVAIISLIPAARAYVYIVPDAKSPDQEGQCYDTQLKIAVPMNEIRQRTGRCESMSCGKDYSLSVVGCGAIGAGPGFIITPTDYSKPYPECCPQLVMSSENLI
uniref:SVWC domain-containing protein n=1 Tax=Anopheles atroparvus TaxID=41427 RepID=A0A182JBF8_ANOAO